MLAVEELTTDYGPVRAVDGVTLGVSEGSVTAVLGANGAGKTTLLRTITGLVPASGGKVTLDGKRIDGRPVEDIVRRGLAHVPEGRGVIAELTVEENLRLGGLWRGKKAAPLQEIYDFFPRLEERRTQAASGLSGGERQMLSIGLRSVWRRCSSPRSWSESAGWPTRWGWRCCWSSRTRAARCRSPTEE
jgi:branched-chain amino acid transport system ATP-binding protein